MEFLEHLVMVVIGTSKDVFPILIVVLGFQLFILKQPVPNARKVIIGVFYVLIGLSMFLVGLDDALFPLGKLMAQQLTDPHFLQGEAANAVHALAWQSYYWVYFFAFAIGFSTTIAEPSLIAVAIKAHAVSGGAVGTWGLRIAVGLGVALGITLGVFRIITGTPLHYYILVGYIIVIIQTLFAPKIIIALAYDSGGVTTSTITVPLVAALGLGLASTIPGRSALLDGFGLIAFASLFPIISVLGYAQFAEWKTKKSASNDFAKGDH